MYTSCSFRFSAELESPTTITRRPRGIDKLRLSKLIAKLQSKYGQLSAGITEESRQAAESRPFPCGDRAPHHVWRRGFAPSDVETKLARPCQAKLQTLF